MDPFIGEIIMFGGNFAPRGWALCDGQLLAISSNSALFSILGTTYGGDGRTTFGLPDLRGRVAMHPGHGPGLTQRNLGQKGGAETVTLNTTQIPSHNHEMVVTSQTGNLETPVNNVLASGKVVSGVKNDEFRAIPASPTEKLNTGAITNTGGSQSHDNVQPFQCVNFIIALVGVYPSRN